MVVTKTFIFNFNHNKREKKGRLIEKANRREENSSIKL